MSWKGRPRQKEGQENGSLWKPTKETVSGRKWSALQNVWKLNKLEGEICTLSLLFKQLLTLRKVIYINEDRSQTELKKWTGRREMKIISFLLRHLTTKGRERSPIPEGIFVQLCVMCACLKCVCVCVCVCVHARARVCVGGIHLRSIIHLKYMV